MRTLAVGIAVMWNLWAGGIAWAHGDHAAQHGGVVARGDDGIVMEFVVEKGVLTLYLDDELGMPVPTREVRGTLTLLARRGPAREVTLAHAGSNRLTAQGVTPASGDRLRAHIIMPNGDEFRANSVIRP